MTDKLATYPTMKYRSIILILIALLGCNPAIKPEKPNNLIPEDDMANILYDVMILNAARGTAKSVLDDSGIMLEEYVYNKYNIDSLQFAKSNEYYSYDVKIYESIITQVDTMLSVNKRKYQAKIDAEIEAKQRSRDSLKKLSDSLSKQRKLKQIRRRDSFPSKKESDKNQSS